MYLRSLILAAVLLSAAGFGLWKWRESYLAAARRIADWEYQRRIEATKAALDQPIELPARELPLYELPELISQASGLAVEIDAQALERAGMVVDTPLPTIAGRFSVRTALDLHLEPLGHGLCYDIHDGRLLITIPDSSRDRTALRVVTYPLLQPEHAGGDVDEDTWADLITRNIEPSDWTDVGGKGHCAVIPGALVIAHSEHTHRQIRRFLNSLERLSSPPQTFAAVPLHPFLAGRSERRIAAALSRPVKGGLRRATLARSDCRSGQAA